MSWLQCLLYGFIMGISEFIPVSSAAQSQILQNLFGLPGNDHIRNLIIHICTLTAFFFVWKQPVDFILPTMQTPGRTRRTKVNAESQFIRTAAFSLLLIMLICFYFSKSTDSIRLTLMLLINGIVLYLPERMLQGNKSAGAMSVFDSWLIGAAGALSVLPGFSRMGMCISVSQMRGADRKNALNWAYILSIPALLLLIAADLAGFVFGGQLTFSTDFAGYLVLALSTFSGGYLSLYFVRNFILHRGLSAYAYYSWGCSLFVFILYLL